MDLNWGSGGLTPGSGGLSTPYTVDDFAWLDQPLNLDPNSQVGVGTFNYTPDQAVWNPDGTPGLAHPSVSGVPLVPQAPGVAFNPSSLEMMFPVTAMDFSVPAVNVSAPAATYVAPPSYSYQAPTMSSPNYTIPSTDATQFNELVNQARSGYQYYLQPGYNEQGLTPYMAAAIANYEMNIKPRIQNEYALLGLGSSPAMAEGVAAGYYSMLPSAIQLQQQGQLAAAQGLGQLAGIDTQRYGIDQQTALGYAGLDTQRYGIDQNTQLGYAGLDTQRYGIDQQAAAAAAARELQAQQIALQGELGYGQLALGGAANELQQRSLALQAMGLAGQLENQQYQLQLDAYYNEMLRLQQLAQWALIGVTPPIGSQTS